MKRWKRKERTYLGRKTRVNIKRNRTDWVILWRGSNSTSRSEMWNKSSPGRWTWKKNLLPLYNYREFIIRDTYSKGFHGSSAGKESTCKAGDPSLTLGLERSPREGIGCPFQYSWASLVAQKVMNPPAMWETWVLSLVWEGHLEEGMANHSSILAWRIPMDRGAWWTIAHGVAKSQTRLSD